MARAKDLEVATKGARAIEAWVARRGVPLNLERANLDGVNLASANLSGANLLQRISERLSWTELR